MTVLSLGFLMSSYLKWSGLTEAEVSVYRGVGAITGLIATFLYPWLRRMLDELYFTEIIDESAQDQVMHCSFPVLPQVLLGVGCLGSHINYVASQSESCQ